MRLFLLGSTSTTIVAALGSLENLGRLALAIKLGRKRIKLEIDTGGLVFEVFAIAEFKQGTLELSGFAVRMRGADWNDRHAAGSYGNKVMREAQRILGQLASLTGASRLTIRAFRVAGSRVNKGEGKTDLVKVYLVDSSGKMTRISSTHTPH